MANIQWFPGHMQKTKREITENLKLVNIVYVVVDARLPYSSFNPMLFDVIKNKPVLVLFNKAKLADENETKKWTKYYNDKGYYTLDVDAITGYNMNKIVGVTKEILAPVIEKNKARGININLRAMIIGIPNVGKSTIINKIVKKKATNVGDKPGVTKSLQWVKISNDIDLLDTPGVLWPKFDDEKIGMSLALSGAIKDDILPIDDVCIYGFEFLSKYYSRAFYERYKFSEYIDFNQAYYDIAKLRGCIKNNEIDYEKVNRLFLHDLRNELLGRITFDRYDELVSI